MINTTHTKTCQVIRFGKLDYQDAWFKQRELVRQRSSGQIGDTLMLLEHPHTYTLGRATRDGHLLVSPETLIAQGVTLIESDRGGDITYHGPGQVVGYPILKLSRHGGDLLRYLRMIEEVIIVVLADYGIKAGRIAGLTGVWVGDAKIAAIGVKLSASGVTQHGFALNVTTDMQYFAQIIPCGIVGKDVTSMARLLDNPPAQHEVERRVAHAFGEVFQVDLQFEANVEDMLH
ncbi:MAG: lipoyl(octanoyl) transferase LipB [Chloroflexi bacterium AL-W]|nr:lipoyl(octanoyl) transferase LipB [Chloroflexi bacterium AL-N1]NOK71420.1 lipoyl(octanoyl) transferase LipB [Chloroflexi bacterium AL-N10]NOK78823.1 lipoyl(octanoyl) transferase LipB [Chloroflexi bacterium AL-N5]NOK86241.1 lipoyl(octanoyl) transferase LipB [Chloroflexi bacterium AL-W]NOK93145.1 lipoyl(octanoyl) transferase LipB [Chloroflexi bacterium AL-N15]